jgi:molybdenum cofactor biosynthesis enzyme MoaA
MEFQKLPLSLDEYRVQTISIVADVINNCNHACTYCHPMENGNWGGGMLSAVQLGDILRASEEAGALEVLLTGGKSLCIRSSTASWIRLGILNAQPWPW